MKKNKVDSSRYRCWTIVFYGSGRELRQILHNNGLRISHWVFILHDKDTYLEDTITDGVVHPKGTPKKEHYHCLVDFYNGHSFTAVKRMFTTDTDNPRVEKVSSRVSQYRYLTHADNPESYQYAKSALVSPDINFYERLLLEGDKPENDNKAESIITDILAGVSPAIMVSRYGRDFVIHMKQYDDCAFAIRMWNIEHPKKPPAPPEQLDVILEDSPFDD